MRTLTDQESLLVTGGQAAPGPIPPIPDYPVFSATAERNQILNTTDTTIEISKDPKIIIGPSDTNALLGSLEDVVRDAFGSVSDAARQAGDLFNAMRDVHP